MMTIRNKKIAILATDGFEESELLSPKKTLEDVGAAVFVVSPKEGKIKSWKNGSWGHEVKVDVTLDDANPAHFDALILPGGVINPDKLRINDKAIAFITHFVEDEKLIAAICHGPWTLIEANGVNNRKMTSWRSIKNDLVNAGAHWVDKEVVQDKNLITSRNPNDLPAFNKKIVDHFK